MNRKATFSLLALFLDACAPQLTAYQRAVRVVPYTELSATCTFLGQIRGTEDFLAGIAFGSEARANQLRRGVAAVGGDTATLFGEGAPVLGDAYRCTNYVHLQPSILEPLV